MINLQIRTLFRRIIALSLPPVPQWLPTIFHEVSVCKLMHDVYVFEFGSFDICSNFRTCCSSKHICATGISCNSYSRVANFARTVCEHNSGNGGFGVRVQKSRIRVLVWCDFLIIYFFFRFIPALSRPVSTWVVTSTTSPAILQKTATLNVVPSTTHVKTQSAMTGKHF